mmetsp:Transcript_20247/g.42310  ORF Transcript_20247/g.42310 Transcript_20247/m.42310 type:complete len:212 (+) Transcript_20247:73-708(+)
MVHMLHHRPVITARTQTRAYWWERESTESQEQRSRHHAYSPKDRSVARLSSAVSTGLDAGLTTLVMVSVRMPSMQPIASLSMSRNTLRGSGIIEDSGSSTSLIIGSTLRLNGGWITSRKISVMAWRTTMWASCTIMRVTWDRMAFRSGSVPPSRCWVTVSAKVKMAAPIVSRSFDSNLSSTCHGRTPWKQSRMSPMLTVMVKPDVSGSSSS